MKIVTVIGTRPQFIKAAVVSKEIVKSNEGGGVQIEEVMVNTGQHYDEMMSDVFFRDLEMLVPKHDLEVREKNQGAMVGKMIERLAYILSTENPDYVLVYGDTNSALAGAIAASKMKIPVVHVEAGLRSHNRRMSEEINRILIDHCSDVLFCPSEASVKNLQKEGFSCSPLNAAKINQYQLNLDLQKLPLSAFPVEFPLVVEVGDVMFDSVLDNSRIDSDIVLEKFGMKKDTEYALVTLHRPENVDSEIILRFWLDLVLDVAEQKKLQTIILLHPRTKKTLARIEKGYADSEFVKFIDPVSYLDMLALEKHVKVILTDSGGVQREAYYLETPCVVLREETEWVELVAEGVCKVTGKPNHFGDFNFTCAGLSSLVDRCIYGYQERRNNAYFLYGIGNTGKLIVNNLLELWGRGG